MRALALKSPVTQIRVQLEIDGKKNLHPGLKFSGGMPLTAL
jgi:hypothetical protein